MNRPEFGVDSDGFCLGLWDTCSASRRSWMSHDLRAGVAQALREETTDCTGLQFGATAQQRYGDLKNAVPVLATTHRMCASQVAPPMALPPDRMPERQPVDPQSRPRSSQHARERPRSMAAVASARCCAPRDYALDAIECDA